MPKMTIKKISIKSELILLLKNNEAPLSVPQILDLFKTKKLSPNKTTIYRHIQSLLESKEITEVILKNGLSFYEYSNHHHHHFFCTVCEGVFCLNICELEPHIHHFEETIKLKNYTVTHHEFNLYGICNNCS
jgi:Fe2+ or Zn2+ uptake regulation protein